MKKLRCLVQQQQSKLTDLQTDVAEIRLQNNELKREMQLLKVRMIAYFVKHLRQDQQTWNSLDKIDRCGTA